MASIRASTSARAVSLGLMAIIAIMFATVVATTDEAIIRDSVTAIPQLGVQISTSLAYLLSPLVFLFFHVNALLLLDLIDQRFLMLDDALKATPDDRTHHLHRLNSFVEIQALAATNAMPMIQWCLRAVSWLSFIGIPLALLLAIQIGYVRSQASTILRIHQALLIIDAIIIFVVLRRRYARHNAEPYSKPKILNYAFVVLIAFVSLVWAKPPSVSEFPTKKEIRDVRWSEADEYRNNRDSFMGRAVFPMLSGHNPLDILFCEEWDWGCRYLSVDKKVLVRNDALISEVELILGDETVKKEDDEDENKNERRKTRLRSIAISLKNHNFFFADFTDSILYGADLSRNDLRGASLEEAHMTGVRLDGSDLRGATLYEARLDWASMKGVDLRCVDLPEVNLQNADLKNAVLYGADLRDSLNLTQRQLDKTYCDYATRLPGYLKFERCFANTRKKEDDLKKAEELDPRPRVACQRDGSE